MVNIFDRYTKEYDNWFIENHYAYLSELVALKEAIEDAEPGIEIGVGTGRFSSMLGIQYGVDLSFNVLKFARDRGCNVFLASAERLPFSPDNFGYALLMNTLCFVDDPKKAIKEAYRIIKKGGKLIVGIIDKKSRLGGIYQKKKSEFYKEANFFSSEQVINFLKSNGFKKISVIQTLFDDIKELKRIDRIKKGFGEGGFVVVSGVK